MKLWPGWLVVLAAACGAGSSSSSTTTPNRDTGAIHDTGTSTEAGPNGGPGGASSARASPLLEANGTIAGVVDGDTVDIDFGDSEVRVRLIGVDTPETMKPNTSIECFGPEASAFTHAMLPNGTPVLVVRDAEARDAYDRLLGYVYRSYDGLFVNLELVAQGYARPLSIEPNVSFRGSFLRAALEAEAADRGLWHGCTG